MLRSMGQIYIRPSPGGRAAADSAPSKAFAKPLFQSDARADGNTAAFRGVEQDIEEKHATASRCRTHLVIQAIHASGNCVHSGDCGPVLLLAGFGANAACADLSGCRPN